MTNRNAIRFDRVNFAYGVAPVLEDVSFTIAEREFAAIIGPNGGGKTTMLKLILGLIEPQTGFVRVFGRTPVVARRRIGFMPQYPGLDTQFPVTVMDVVLLARLGGGHRIGRYSGADRAAAAQALEDLGLAAIGNRSYSKLSSGQRQRVLIARALASDPEILLLDEPTANLDPFVQDDLYELLHRLNEKLTVLVVSHDVGFVSKYVEKVVCVNRRVVLHPASAVKGELVSMLYGDMEMRVVDHGHHPD
ncbi:MAG: ABC transporter ATP-binding protein [Candidatus Krumholzibacteria bacterium]|nr:ABC transporter ATP-binding protein [Candidatus Krumholzibacteria bacterium]MCK5620404.1 ABC transporter ATP-binding protein [Candidatus Krumholzibacteria bacterium]